MQYDYKKFEAMLTGEDYYHKEIGKVTQSPSTPVLSYTDPLNFVNRLLCLTNNKQEIIFSIIEDKCKQEYMAKSKKELNWLKNIKQIISIESDKRKSEKKLSGFLLANFVIRLGDMIERLNKNSLE